MKVGAELWAEGQSREQFQKNLNSLNVENKKDLFSESNSFKVQVEVFGKKIPNNDKVAKISELLDCPCLPFKGSVNLTNPDVTICYFEAWGRPEEEGSRKELESGVGCQEKDPGVKGQELGPDHIMLGRKIGDGRRESITKLSIKNRKFIGNTTMDPELSLLMANMACVQVLLILLLLHMILQGGSLTLDPFVGTGSLLIAAAGVFLLLNLLCSASSCS